MRLVTGHKHGHTRELRGFLGLQTCDAEESLVVNQRSVDARGKINLIGRILESARSPQHMAQICCAHSVGCWIKTGERR